MTNPISAPYILETVQVGKTYGRKRKERITAVRDVSLQLIQGECRGLVGESGCGKSTLLRMLAGLETPDSGTILYQGIPVEKAVNQKRNEIQMIFQNSREAVNSYVTAREIVEEPIRNFGFFRPGLGRTERRTYVEQLFAQTGLGPECLDKYPEQFSGGQLQRICITRALAAKPKLLLLDEPLSSLDVSVQAQILELLKKLGKEHGLTQLMVSHDLAAVYEIADSITVMYGGCVMEEIASIDLFDRLCHPYTRLLLRAGGQNLEERDGSGQRQWELGRMISMERNREDPLTDGCPCRQFCGHPQEICRKKLPTLRTMEPGHRIRCFAAAEAC